MEFETIRYELAGGVAVITLNRPEVMNALNTAMRVEITTALRRASAEARVVVLTGAGRAFCSGQDLGDGVTAATLDLERVLRDEYEPMLEAITNCPVPTIAAVNGVAAGAGANLALAADVVIGADGAAFIQAFTRIGLMPDAGGTFWLPRQVGAARAMGAMLFADRIPARQAAQWGMIWEAVPDEAFEAHWRARAAHLADGPTRAYGAIKAALRATWANDLPAQLTLEAQLQGGCGASDDFREGVASFLEKRAAVFAGR
ncbi:2-(1,2-epoxy-1,2-dihydrophenyl)acetyl-CoA isomerase [Rhodobacter veldkampii DSM 11550]|uniref:2-(1,2-epoxy-1,2-dihydrophenyl)acetyl-CoA isomerase n=1 Tax=Phaeovulum veldkampii DSM 11550 TaxID=1185920 RepID=A0A2T4JMP6_9RHOB|nr:enoyl-CoA hydratase-related protein [Phaeovulum veldkampii]MBK5946287.1 2-(1,2-epoxy-1,2-dihydrophenyl)acetyl-CoA isomerase [Phaeovulum veldkampii DSM 11550]NCU20341.1 2-(1,2-epoxy-1,2-dihydrophenyl)acetyl-CoA isomerase [Candidatus Falkowbacteria bacterium]PTE19160.1 2-(1,2-epoxy-1,2-dihydrophenyl)acetyl-CoA isomerase [Phaeovulum veldkampii DSM 11550]TDQ61379.1 2-(1,2-epoxy-1,2-dihydrophenyl)acetyl-CoA isomerase [Phaeovulum veldkampii DSM 11550]